MLGNVYRLALVSTSTLDAAECAFARHLLLCMHCCWSSSKSNFGMGLSSSESRGVKLHEVGVVSLVADVNSGCVLSKQQQNGSRGRESASRFKQLYHSSWPPVDLMKRAAGILTVPT